MVLAVSYVFTRSVTLPRFTQLGTISLFLLS